MSRDKALEWFLEDAEDQGLTLSEYEHKYGIILEMKLPPPARHRIMRNEVPAGNMTDEDLALTIHKEKRRAETRRAVANLVPPDDCE